MRILRIPGCSLGRSEDGAQLDVQQPPGGCRLTFTPLKSENDTFRKIPKPSQKATELVPVTGRPITGRNLDTD